MPRLVISMPTYRILFRNLCYLHFLHISILSMGQDFTSPVNDRLFCEIDQKTFEAFSVYYEPENIRKYIEIYRNRNWKSILEDDIVPVQLHIVRNDDGTGGVSLEKILGSVDLLNEYFSNVNLIFEVCPNVDYIDNSDFLMVSCDDDYTNITAVYNENAVNIYYVESIDCLAGFFTERDGMKYIVMSETPDIVLVHEVGHYFGLLHTHGKFNAEPPDYNALALQSNGFPTPVYYEGVVKYDDPSFDDNLNLIADCYETGDNICDTPAEPVLIGKLNQNICAYTGNDQDYYGDTYTPEVGNIMSYGLYTCLDHFSGEQYDMIRYVFDNFNENLMPGSCGVFIQDTIRPDIFTDECSSLGYSYTPANSWGYIAGTNGYGDLEKAQRLRYTGEGNYRVEQAIVYFSRTSVVDDGELFALLYDVDDFTGGPGEVLAVSTPILISAIPVSDGFIYPTYFNFLDTPELDLDEFFISIDISQLYSSEDTLSIAMTPLGCGEGNDSWELFSDGFTWLPIDDGSTWQIESNFWIFGILGIGQLDLPAPQLLSPVNQETGVSIIPEFLWTEAPNALDYAIQIAYDDQFTDVIAEEYGVLSTSFTLLLPEYNTEYYWRVMAIGSSDESPWSEIWSFTSEAEDPNAGINQDTLSPEILSDECAQLAYSIVPGSTWGYVGGTNGYLDLEKAQRLKYMGNDSFTVTQARIFFTVAKVIGDGQIYAKVYDVDDVSGGPGNEISVSLPLNTSDIQTPGDFLQPTYFYFPSPSRVKLNEFFISIDFSNLYSANDTVSLAMTDFDCGNGDDSWELFSDGTTWLSLNDPSSWQIETNFFISGIIQFSTTDLPAPQLISPVNGATDIPVNVEFMWNNVSNASSYTLQAATNSNFSNPIVSETGLLTNSYSSSLIDYNTLYYWRVKAVNSSLESPWSQTWNFTTAQDMSCGTIIKAGNVSGTWDLAGSPYCVMGDATVPDGDSLTVEAGVEVLFSENISLTANGHLIAVGEESNPISFKAKEENKYWGSLIFGRDVQNLNSVISYCNITNATNGVTVYSRKIRIEYCQISDNNKSGIVWEAGENNSEGIIAPSSDKITSGNENFPKSINVDYSGEISNNEIVNNQEWGIECRVNIGAAEVHLSPTINGNSIENNNAGGILMEATGISVNGPFANCTHEGYASPSIVGNTIRNNNGFGISCIAKGRRETADSGCDHLGFAFTNPTIELNLIYMNEGGISANAAFNDGGQDYLSESRPKINHCTFGDNGNIDILAGDSSNIEVINSIFWGGQISGNQSQGGGSWTASYSNFETAQSGPGNLSTDPLFTDPGNGDFHLQCTSPVIDQGNPDSSSDLDGTRADMGAFSFNQSTLSGSASNDGPVCEGGTIHLAAAGGTTYSWEGPNAFQSSQKNPELSSVTSNMAGVYMVTVTDNQGCPKVVTTNVVIKTNPSALVNGQLEICKGSSAILTATGGLNYSWSNGESTASINVNPVNTTMYIVTVTDDAGCSDTESTAVTVYDNPAANIAGNTVTCPGENTMLTASGGISYQWDTGANTAAINVNPQVNKTYTVTVTDANGCSDTESITVTVDNVGTATISGDTNICTGESTSLSASEGAGYLWSTGETTKDIMVTPASTGSYSVTVTSDSGCTGSDQVTITIIDPSTATITGNTEICSGESSELTAPPGFMYSWSTGESSQKINVNPIENQIYSLTITDNGGCSDSVSTTVKVEETPGASIAGIEMICPGESAQLTASGGQSYNWSTGETAEIITVSPIENTNYRVTVTAVNGCSDTDDKAVSIVDLSNISISNDTSICAGESAKLTASGGTNYLWNTQATTGNIDVTPQNTTNYTVTVTDINGCTITKSVQVTVFNLPTASIDGNSRICAGESTTLQAPEDYTYSWNTGETSRAITVDPSLNTTYRLTVTNDQGCNDTESVHIVVDQLPSATISGDSEICAGESTTLTASGGAEYIWSTNESTSMITVSPEMNIGYSVTVTSQQGCTDEENVMVKVKETPEASISGTTTICSGESVTLSGSGGNTYKWSTGEENQSIDVNPSVTTSYALTVTGPNGCTDKEEVEVAVSQASNAAITGRIDICPGESTVLTANGGSLYTWSTGQKTRSITVKPSSQTDYNVTVTDKNDCTGSAMTTVTVRELPMVEITGKTEICQGENTVLTASGGSSYRWSTGQTTSSISIKPVRTISVFVIVETDFGCSNVANTVVTVHPAPSATISGPTEICSGASFMLSASGGESFRWNTDANSQEIEPEIQSSTVFSVTVTDATGCTDVTTHEVSVESFINPQISGNLEICAGESTVLTASEAPNFLWSTGEKTAAITVIPNSNTSYSVTASDNSGCNGTNSVVVEVNPLPSVAIDGQNSVCEGGSSVLTASGGASYEWSTGETGNPITVSPANETKYTVTATDSHGCSQTESIVVSLKTALSVSINGETDICEGESSMLTATGGTIFNWNTGEITASITVSPSNSTTYTVTASDDQGCSGEESITVSVEDAKTAEIQIESNNMKVCKGEAVVLWANPVNGGNSPGYQWTVNGEVSNVMGDTLMLEVPEDGDQIQCMMTSSETCLTENPVTSNLIEIAVDPLPNVNIDFRDTVFVSEASIPLSGGMPEGGTYTGDLVENNELVISSENAGTTTTIHYTYTDENGCTEMASTEVYIEMSTVTIDPSLENLMIIFPNPAMDRFQISFSEGTGITEIAIYNMEGSLVWKKQLGNRIVENDIINVRGLQPGLYLVSVTGAWGVVLRKVMVL